MKKINAFLMVLAISGSTIAQTTDTVSMGANYVNANYYNLKSGTKTSVVRNNWDLAFGTNILGFGSSTIRINDATGTELYVYGTDTSKWNNVDTSGFTFTKITNSDSSWRDGAFSNFLLSPGGLDLGWGAYDMVTHGVIGTRIFILKLSNGNLKKMMVEKLAGGEYFFKYSDLDNSNEVNTSIKKTDFATKNFAYYSIQNNKAEDREPAATSWDLIFTKYARGTDGYIVSGVLANVGVKIAKASKIDTATITHNALYFDTNFVNVMGYDWKKYVHPTGYVVEDSLAYFVQTSDSNIYKVIFTGFGGGTDGNFIFTKKWGAKIEAPAAPIDTTIGVAENNFNKVLSVFPNPANNVINVTLINAEQNTKLSILDLTGKEIKSTYLSNEKGLVQSKIDVSNLNKGIYFLSIVSKNNRITKKIIIQ